MQKGKVVSVALVLAGVVALLFLGSCDTGGTPVQTIRWEQDGSGFIQFYTNDSENLSYTFWSAHELGQDLSAGPVEITVKKNSGDPSYGFGMIFDYIDEDNFGRVLITRSGAYQVARKENGTFTYPQNFASSNAVRTSSGAENVIRVTDVSSTDEITVTINGTEVFNDVYGTLLGGTRVGGIAGVSDQEQFPEVPVDVRYKLNEPVTYP